MFGKREVAAMSVVNFIDNIRRDIFFYLKWLMSSDLRKAMSDNINLKDKHRGKRCFIIGNGPSLKHYDLSKLTNECVFTVNYMMKSEYFKILNPDYHLFFDPIVFSLNPDNIDDKAKFDLIDQTASTNPDLQYIIPFRRKSNFNKLFPKHKFIYLYNYKIYTKRLKRVSELDRIIPIFQNVILYAINSAIHMGFDQIYLMGVDMTGFMEHFEYNKTNDQWGHSYKKTEEDQLKIKKILAEQNLDNEFYLKAIGKTFEHFKIMNLHAKAKNVKLYNASDHGGLDVLERIDYKSLF